MKSGTPFSDAQLKLWMRRVQTEMSKGTPPQQTLDLVKTAMTAQSAGESELFSVIEPPEKLAKKP
ncbi:hypothetical protein [Rhizobium herbae]|jgi:hypothetical protein